MTEDQKPGYVLIHDRWYKTVARRVWEFREDFKLTDSWGINTEIIGNTDEVILIKATVTDPMGMPVATGHAEEERGSSNINSTSALENCETSAIGRALAAAGFGGSDAEYASADEMARANTLRDQLDEGKMSPVKMKKYVTGMMECVERQDGPGLIELGDDLTNEQKQWLWRQFRSYERTAINKLAKEAEAELNPPVDPDISQSPTD